MTAHHGGEHPGDRAGMLASVRAAGDPLALQVLQGGETQLAVPGGVVHAVLGAPPLARRFLARLAGTGGGHPAEGVLVAGKPARLSSRAASNAAGIAVVTGGQAISWSQTVGENVLLGNERSAGLRGAVARLFGRRPEPGTHVSDTERASRALALVGLGRAQAEPVSGLSSVERRLVELARAVAAESAVVLVDDIGAGLTDADRGRWWNAVAAVAAAARPSGAPPAVLLVSGTVTGLASVADRATVLAGSATAPPTATFELRSTSDERLVLEALAASFGEVPDESAGSGVGVGTGPGPGTGAGAGASAATAGLTVERWTASHPADADRTVVDGLTFDCAPGEVLGLFGPADSGAGEVLLSVFGRSYGARISGAVLIDGAAVDVSTTDRARAAGVLYTTEHPIRFDLSFLGGVPSSVSPESLTRMVSVGVADARRDYRATTVPSGLVAALPGAHRGPSAAQFTESLHLLVASPARVVLLAEPFGDPRAADAAERRELIRALAATGRSVVVSSEDPSALAAVCDRVLAVRAGRIVGEVDPRETASRRRSTPSDLLAAMGGLA
ncbi:hypothetical protein KXS11_07480 [Plantibacter flavus]|uniref:hypothetical protein n=1 Tax=Plantibacter flavus TaxID=150123 RepID=UPI003F1377CA